MQRCQGYRSDGKKCHTRIRGGGIYCCDRHKSKNYDDVIEECNICCDTLENEDLRILKCGHAHHRSCLDSWIKTCRDSVPGCPLCRAPIRMHPKKIKVKKNNIIPVYEFQINDQNNIINNILDLSPEGVTTEEWSAIVDDQWSNAIIGGDQWSHALNVDFIGS